MARAIASLAEGFGEMELARSSPQAYTSLKKTQLIFAGVIAAAFLGIFALAVIATAQQNKIQKLEKAAASRRENEKWIATGL